MDISRNCVQLTIPINVGNFHEVPYFRMNCTSTASHRQFLIPACFHLFLIVFFQAEISLCRVYKRAGVEDHPSLPRSLPSRASSSRLTHTSTRRQQYDTVQNSIENFQAFGGQQSHEPSEVEKMNETDGSSTSDITTALGLSKPNAYRPTASTSTLGLPAPMEEEGMALLHHSKQASPLVNSTCASLFTGSLPSVSSNAVDDLHRLINYQQGASSISQQQHYYNGHHHPASQLMSNFPPHSQPLGLNTLPNVLPTALSDRILWDWNPISEANREYTNLFK